MKTNEMTNFLETIMSSGNGKMEGYEKYEIRMEFERALSRSRLRAVIGKIIDALCAIHGALGLGNVVALSAEGVAGRVDGHGRPVASLPRLKQADRERWNALYPVCRERGSVPVGGIRINGRFYVDDSRDSAVRLELARIFGCELIPRETAYSDGSSECKPGLPRGCGRLVHAC